MGRRVYATVAAKLGSGSLGVRLGVVVSHLAAMPRGLRHSVPICFGAVWRDDRRCDRSRVSWVGGSEIGLEDPTQVGDLRGFIGMLGRSGRPTAGWILSSARLRSCRTRSARRPRRTSSYLEMISRTSILLIFGVSSDHLFTIIAAHPAATLTQSVRIHIPCVPPPLPCTRDARPLTQVPQRRSWTRERRRR